MSPLKIRLKHQRLADRVKSKEKKAKRRLVCETCDLKFLSWWDIWEHWKSTGHKQPENCRWCSKETFTLQSHLCKKHWSVATMCPFCGQLFMFMEDMERHRLSHDGTSFRCYHCGRRRRSEQLLRDHVLTHYHEDRYGCALCEKRFKKKKNLERHLKQVHFQCPYCGSNAKSYTELVSHIKDHNDLVCVHCHKVFSQKNRLKYHYQIKHGDQDVYRCNQCPKRFPIKSRLLNHVALAHKGHANFRCRFCRKPFLYRQPYLNHIAAKHTKSRPLDSFICHLCGFTTDRKVKLQWHNEGTSALGFGCQVCQVQLGCRGLYDKHMESHADKYRLFVCPHCQQAYGSDTSLRHHVSWKHPEVLMSSHPRAFPCLEPECNKYYITKSSLARHMRRSHAPKAELEPIPRKRGRKAGRGRTKSCGKENRPVRVSHRIMKLELARVSPGTNQSEVDVYYCDICDKTWFHGLESFKRHLGSHGKKVWHEECEECDKVLETPEEAVRHYVEEHLNAEFVS